jgi:L-malate glycosyltransferase
LQILHTARTYAPQLDGVAEVVRNVSEELVRRGHDVCIATGIVRNLPREEVVNGVRVHRFAVRGNQAKGLDGEVERYRKFVWSGAWDIVVNHCVETWTTDALLKDIRSFPWRCILVTHGLSVADPLYEGYYRAMPDFLAKYWCWVTVSAVNEEAAYADRQGIKRPMVVRNGVRLEEWDTAHVDLRSEWHVGNNTWIVNLSNHSPSKGHNIFFKLATQLHTASPRFTIIGNAYPADRWGLGRLGVRGGCFYECRLRSLLSSAVDLRMAGRRQATSAIQQADILVSTSVREANSLVLLESMAAGTPWVSFDVGSARDNAGGVVVSDLDEMIEAVRELVRKPDWGEELGREGRARAREKHDWNRIVDQYEELYENAIGQRTQAVSAR